MSQLGSLDTLVRGPVQSRIPVGQATGLWQTRRSANLNSRRPCDGFPQRDQFIIHFLFAGHGPGDFQSQQDAKPFAKSMYSDSQRASGHFQLASHLGISCITGAASQKDSTAIKQILFPPGHILLVQSPNSAVQQRQRPLLFKNPFGRLCIRQRRRTLRFRHIKVERQNCVRAAPFDRPVLFEFLRKEAFEQRQQKCSKPTALGIGSFQKGPLDQA